MICNECKETILKWIKEAPDVDYIGEYLKERLNNLN